MPERFSASVAGRHMACHASADLPAAIPNWVPPVVDRSKGTKATGTTVHKVVEDLVNTKLVTKSQTVKFNAKDMLAVGRLLTYIGEVWSQRRFTVLSEHTVTATWLATNPNTTADLVFYTKDQLEIVDIKWGVIPVEVVENEQLLFYAASYGHLAPKAKGVRVHIVQPRANNMESWFIDTSRLGQFMAEAQAAEAAIQAGDVTFGPSDHCTFCPANPHSRGDKGRPLCPTMMQLLYPSVGVDEDAVLAL